MMDVREKYEEDINRFHELVQVTGELQDRLYEAEAELAGLSRELELEGINPYDYDL